MKQYLSCCAALLAVLTLGAAEHAAVIEAEKVLTGVKPAANSLSSSRWDLWSRDKNAEKNWSQGATLRGGAVKRDSEPDRADLPVLMFRIPVEAPGVYDLFVKLGGRNLAVSVDDGDWRKLSGEQRIVENRICRAGDTIGVRVSACFVQQGNPGPVYVDCFKLVKTSDLIDGKYVSMDFQAENLLRGTKLPRNRLSSSAWDVWDKDRNAEKNWSQGATIRGGAVKRDSAPDRAALPILTFHIPIPADGRFSLSVTLGHRALAVSADGGKTWRKSRGKTLLFRDRQCRKGETVTVMIAACYEEPGAQGPVYVDYFTLSNIPGASSGLKNPGFTRKRPDGSPEGWSVKFQDKHPGDSVTVIDTAEGKAVRLRSAGPNYWNFDNEGRIEGCIPGERWEVRFAVTNPAKGPNRIFTTFHGFSGNTNVRPFLGLVKDVIPGGTTRTISSVATVPEGVNDLMVSLHGMDSGVELIIHPVAIRRLPGVTEAAEKIDWLAELGSTGQWTSIRPVMPSSAVEVTFTLAPDSRRTGRIVLQGFSAGRLYNSSLREVDLEKLGSASGTMQCFIPYDVDGIRLEVDKGIVFSALNVRSIPVVRPVSRPRKLTDGFAAERVGEKLGRGLVAIPMKDGRIFLSWRITDTDAPDCGFDVFSSAGGKERKLNASPVIQTSDFIVDAPVAGAEYIVRPAPGSSGAEGRAKALDKAEDGGLPFRRFLLSDPAASPQHIATADLDGDGEYDYVVSHSSDGVDPWYVAWRPSKKRMVLEAFRRDGRRLWTKRMTWNIEGGTWYHPWLAYDVNGDGRAEVILKGALPEDGDRREPPESINAGKVISGPEHILVLDGTTGELLASAPWPPRDEFQLDPWGYNFSSRNQLAIAYLDGRTPCIIALRGTYNLMLAEAWQMKNGKLEPIWQYNSREFGLRYRGQGAHTTRVADADGDGRDEIFLGAAVLDDDGSPLWSTGLGHPDYIYVADIMPDRPGLEALTMYETNTPGGGGVTCADAATGKVIWRLERPAKHFHYGYAADIDARYRGWESGAEDVVNGGHNGKRLSYHFSPSGKILGENASAPYANYRNFIPRFAYWDGDLLREEIGNRVIDFRGGQVGGLLFGDVMAAFDSDGDWREEVVTSCRGEFRVYSTVIPASDRRKSLMYDPIYRMAVASNANGYILDAPHRKLLIDEAPGISLTVLAGEKDTLEITVTSPKHAGVAGTVKLKKNPAIGFDPAHFDVDIPAGKEHTVRVKLSPVDDRPARIEAVLEFADGRKLAGSVDTGKELLPWELPPPPPFVDAEKFVSQSAGNAVIRSDKVGTYRESISHWDRKGHRIEWEIAVERKGSYRIMLRHCSVGAASRTLFLDGQKIGTFALPATGGLGLRAADWRSTVLESSPGDPAVLTLDAGTHRIALENPDNTTMNLDHIRLIEEENNPKHQEKKP